MKIRILLVSLMLIAANVLNGQDQIVRRNGEIIKATVKEIGTSEIKYVQEELNRNVIFTIDADQVEKIIFSDGKEFKIDHRDKNRETTEQNSTDLFLIQRKNALKLDFLSPVFNTTSITYERCLKPGGSVEFTLGAVGLGFAEHNDKATGILFKGGYKFIRSPDFYLRGLRYAHILKGRYAKLEFDFSSYSFKSYNYYYTGITNDRETNNKWALLVVLGSQSVFNNNFVIDTYLGVGIGMNSNNQYYGSNPHGFFAGESEFPLAGSAGIRIGFLFDKKATK